VSDLSGNRLAELGLDIEHGDDLDLSMDEQYELVKELIRRRAELPVIAGIVEQAAHVGGLSKEGYGALAAAIAGSDGQ
jgi:hypothetical protein